MFVHSAQHDGRLEQRLALLKCVCWLARRLPKRRVSRFCDRLFYLHANRHQSVNLIAPYRRNLFIHIDTDSWLERWIFNRGCYEPEVIEFLERALRPGMVALDVGANIGAHTLVMAQAVGDRGRVLAFEPNPGIRRRLQSNVDLNRFSHVTISPACVSNQPGPLTLFMPLDEEYNQGLSSLHRSNLGHRCQELLVDSCTLDDFVHSEGLPRVDLIKIDVEGHEFAVLAGARETLRIHRPMLILEFSLPQWARAGVRPETVEDFLTEQGYGLFALRESGITSVRHGTTEECNLLAVPQTSRNAAPLPRSRSEMRRATEKVG